ncbi:MAG: hypothetical protein WCG06_05940, partial [Candidatus Omnitrophota bacterium]
MTSLRKISIAIFFLSCCFSSALQAATAFDHSAWDAFLKKNVNEKGEVNYRSVAGDPKALDDYLASLRE